MDEEEIRKCVEAAGAAGLPTPVRLTVRYHPDLWNITGVSEEPMLMGGSGTFLYVLQNILAAHPEIEKKYPPGALAIFLNDSIPKPHSPLFDGDLIRLAPKDSFLPPRSA